MRNNKKKADNLSVAIAILYIIIFSNIIENKSETFIVEYKEQKFKPVLIHKEIEKYAYQKAVNNYPNEIQVCLYGNKKGKIIRIDSFKNPIMIYSTRSSAQSLGCGDESVSLVHSHTNDNPSMRVQYCYPSDVDIDTLKNTGKQYDGLICIYQGNRDKFIFYDREGNIYNYRAYS